MPIYVAPSKPLGSVVVNIADTPTAGDVLTATSATAADWEPVSAAISGVTVTGTAAAGQAPIATSSSAGAWAYPPGYELDYAQITTSFTVTATSDATATAAITGAAITYDGATRVRVEAFAPYCDITAAQAIVLNLYDGNTDIGRLALLNDPDGANNGNSPIYAQRFLTPSNAAHTYSIRAWKTGGTVSLVAGAGGVATPSPAFLRITKA